MQAGRKKFTFRTKKGHDFCENCIRKKDMCILLAEVRKHERGRKKAGPLGSGGSQAPCDPLRPPGKPCAQRWTVKDCLCLQRFCRGGTVPRLPKLCNNFGFPQGNHMDCLRRCDFVSKSPGGALLLPYNGWCGKRSYTTMETKNRTASAILFLICSITAY